MTYFAQTGNSETILDSPLLDIFPLLTFKFYPCYPNSVMMNCYSQEKIFLVKLSHIKVSGAPRNYSYECFWASDRSPILGPYSLFTTSTVCCVNFYFFFYHTL